MLKFQSLLLLALASCALAQGQKDEKYGKGKGHGGKGPRNFIMVIPDGFGPASETMARDYFHWKNNETSFLPIDEMVIGQIRTRASNSYVTDSASSATAYSCGIKTYNGAIGINEEYEPCGTVLEAAKQSGFKTGLVVTSRITHATPASYVAHVAHRDDEANIAAQLIGYTHPLGPQVDIIMGGGRCWFTPQSTKDSCRSDDVNLLDWAKKTGYSVFTNRQGYEKKQKLPYVGLFTEDHMTYDIDRDEKLEPALHEMSLKALNDLEAATRKSKKGFFIMIEASRIDHAGHNNDPVGHLHDIMEYNQVMLSVRQWIDKHSDNPTVLISTADHECGGLTIGQDYDYQPKHFANAVATSDLLGDNWKAYSGSDARGYLITEIFGKYGVSDPTDAEIAAAEGAKGSSSASGLVFAKALSDRLRIDWSTLGHTGVDVTLYGWGKGSAAFAGNRENTEVAGFVAGQLGLNLEKVTEKLMANTTWRENYVEPQDDIGLPEKRSMSHGHH